MGSRPALGHEFHEKVARIPIVGKKKWEERLARLSSTFRRGFGDDRQVRVGSKDANALEHHHPFSGATGVVAQRGRNLAVQPFDFACGLLHRSSAERPGKITTPPVNRR